MYKRQGHYNLTNSVNVNDSKLDDIKVDAYELGWRCTGDSVYTPVSYTHLDVYKRQGLNYSVLF
ncbi:hypothetical protein [Erwinia amylovora]